MSHETVVQFFDAVFQDQTLQGKLNYAFAAIAPEALSEFAQENGYNFTSEELQAVLEQQAELSDEQLSSVAGGRPTDFVREGGSPWVQNQSYSSTTPDELSEEAYPSAVETFRSLAN